MLLHRRNGEDIHVEKSSTSTSTVIVILVMYLCTSSILAWCFGVIHDESAARSQSKIGGDFIVGTTVRTVVCVLTYIFTSANSAGLSIRNWAPQPHLLRPPSLTLMAPILGECTKRLLHTRLVHAMFLSSPFGGQADANNHKESLSVLKTLAVTLHTACSFRQFLTVPTVCCFPLL